MTTPTAHRPAASSGRRRAGLVLLLALLSMGATILLAGPASAAPAAPAAGTHGWMRS